METRQGELRSLFLHPIRSTDGIHAETPFEHQALADRHPLLQILGQIAPAHHLELPRGVIGAQAVDAHGHLGHRRLVVLGVTDLGGLQHLSFDQAVIHAPVHGFEPPS
jgi:hypothetical protein